MKTSEIGRYQVWLTYKWSHPFDSIFISFRCEQETSAWAFHGVTFQLGDAGRRHFGNDQTQNPNEIIGNHRLVQRIESKSVRRDARRHRALIQVRCPNGKMTKKDMLKCYKDLSTCDMDKIEHVVNAIYQAFDIDNDGKVGQWSRKACRSSFSSSLEQIFANSSSVFSWPPKARWKKN